MYSSCVLRHMYFYVIESNYLEHMLIVLWFSVSQEGNATSMYFCVVLWGESGVLNE